MLTRSLPGLILLLAVCRVMASEPLVLHTAGQISTAPKYVLQDGKVKGICPSLLAAIQGRDGKLDIRGADTLLSTPLIEKGLESGRLDLFCGLLKNQLREAQMRFLNPPLYTIQFRVVVRREGIVPVKDMDDLRRKSLLMPVIATAGLASTRALLEQGVRVDASSSDNLSSLRRLQAGRGMYYFSSDEILLALMESEHANGWATMLPAVFGEEPMYLVVSRQLPAPTLKRIQSALEQLAAAGELKQIVADGKKQFGAQ
ncbi:substrate-binding periplasmic protein [Chitinimonas naiadis]